MAHVGTSLGAVFFVLPITVASLSHVRIYVLHTDSPRFPYLWLVNTPFLLEMCHAVSFYCSKH